MAVITPEHLQMASQLGACSERRTAYRVGMDLSEVRCSDLAWMVDRLGKYAAAFAVAVTSDLIIFGTVPTELIGYGSSSGYGYGDGDGDGYGYGDYGYGDGSGGYGYGDYGDGDDYGDGYGYGDGDYGYGSSSGDGSGYGSGYGSGG